MRGTEGERRERGKRRVREERVKELENKVCKCE
jgi:hypothetical protein